MGDQVVALKDETNGVVPVESQSRSLYFRVETPLIIRSPLS